MGNADSVTIAHDYFTQRGGAERVAAALIKALHPDRVVTALHTPATTFSIGSGPVPETTFLQRVSAFRADPRRALPAFPAAWQMMQPVTEGVLICSSSGWSHALRTSGSALKVVYCHNPARWLYQPDDYFKDQPKIIRGMMRLLRPLLTRWDQNAARTADVYIANSTAVAERIRSVYHREPVIIHPPVSIDPSGDQVEVPGLDPAYFLTVGRGRGYKNTQSLIEAFAQLPDERLVIVMSSPPSTPLPQNVRIVTKVSDAQLRWLYANATALVSVSHEDFGLTPLEANALGTPALVLQAGGFLDSLDEGVSGHYIRDASVSTIAESVRTFPRTWDRAAVEAHARLFSLDSFLRRLTDTISATGDRR